MCSAPLASICSALLRSPPFCANLRCAAMLYSAPTLLLSCALFCATSLAFCSTRCSTLLCSPSFCAALLDTALRCAALRCSTQLCSALLCSALFCAGVCSAACSASLACAMSMPSDESIPAMPIQYFSQSPFPPTLIPAQPRRHCPSRGGDHGSQPEG